jgi:FtsP/CotA-like multicopper oxidase with cupredoxin domain
MRTTRREFLQVSAAAGAAALFSVRRAYAAYAQSPALLKFGPGQRLRYFGIDIPLATPLASPYSGVDYYEIAMRQYTDVLHPSLGPTTLRGYTNAANTGAQKHLEGAILARVNKPVRVKWINELPAYMPMPVDPTLVEPFAFGQSLGNDRVAPHLHGGLVPWPSDGGPFHWFSNGGAVKGPSVVNWLPDAYGNPDASDDYWYPNVQSARFMWYHDHAVGLTRLNPHLGLASGYILTDENEGLLPSAGPTLMKMLAIPEGDLRRQVHLVVQDKIFASSPYNSGPSDLWYPYSYDEEFFGAPENGDSPLPTPSLVPEFWGDTMLMNGTVFPYIDVEPRRYRFRILNACNTRFLSLRLVGSMGRPFPFNAEPDLTKPGPAMTLIGTEGGFLDGTVAPKGVLYNNTAAMPLVLAPAERADVIIDFSQLQTAALSGTNQGPLCLLLHNDAPVPFPGGTPLGDFYPANKKLPLPPSPGYGPNTRTLLQFRVFPLGALTGNSSPDPVPDPAWALPPAPAPAPTIPGTRDVALYETEDEYGRLAQNLGTLPFPLGMLDAPTEVVHAGTVEVWRVFNATADTHPIHFHFFNVRVLKREPFSWRGGMPNITGQPQPPDPAEQGWKETVKFNPGECTTILVDLPSTSGLAPEGVTIPESPRTGKHEYVWHCHILEHEEHDMMRPLIVTP